MTLLNGNENSFSDQICTKAAQVQAIIGETYSSVSMALAQSIGPFRVPIVRTFLDLIKLYLQIIYNKLIKAIH